MKEDGALEEWAAVLPTPDQRSLANRVAETGKKEIVAAIFAAEGIHATPRKAEAPVKWNASFKNVEPGTFFSSVPKAVGVAVMDIAGNGQ